MSQKCKSFSSFRFRPPKMSIAKKFPYEEKGQIVSLLMFNSVLKRFYVSMLKLLDTSCFGRGDLVLRKAHLYIFVVL